MRVLNRMPADARDDAANQRAVLSEQGAQYLIRFLGSDGHVGGYCAKSYPRSEQADPAAALSIQAMSSLQSGGVYDRQRDAIVVAMLLAAVISALSFGYSSPLGTTAFVSTCAVLSLLVWRSGDDLALGVSGLIFGPAIEWAATSSGLWRYAAPSIAGLPLWVLPMWWIYPVAVTRLVRAVTGQRLRPSSGWFAVALMGLLVPWLCLFGQRQAGVALAGTVVLLSVFLYRHHSRMDVAALVICGVIGPAVELLPVGMGAWSHADTGWLGLPIWLPSGYGVFGVALIHAGLSLHAAITGGYRQSSRTTARGTPRLPQARSATNAGA